MRLAQVKPWVGVAVVIGVALVGYSAFRMWQWSTDSTTLTDTQSEIAEVGLPHEVPSLEALQEELEERKELRERWAEVFRYTGYPETDLLMAVVSDAAEKSGVSLKSMAVSAELEGAATFGSLQYHAQHLSLSLTSETHPDIYRFLSELRGRAPFFEVTRINLTGFTSIPSAKIDLRLYLNPEQVSEDKDTT